MLRKFLDPAITKTTLLAVAIVFALASSLTAGLVCPFCSAVNLTFTEQLKSNDVVVIAKLLKIPEISDDPDAELPKAEFEIADVIKGDKWVRPEMKFQTLLVGRYPVGQEFMVMGVDPPSVAWSTPMKASERVIGYLKKLEELPQSGPERLEFFQKFFEDKESVLAFDAYDEFARAPYQDLLALKDKMDHDQLIKWIKDPETSINRRRLYFTMLGVCGGESDIEVFEDLIKSGDRKKQAGLDALIASYLNLKGEAGVGLIEDTFIKDQSVDYVDTLSAVSALRFHGTEVDVVPKERIVAAVRLLLDRPKMADMIIPDLARWEDWSVMDRLAQMFKDADEDTNWLRVPVITYLRACPDPKAKVHIEELSKIDPDAVRRADFFLNFGDDEFGDDEDDEEQTKEESKADATGGGADKPDKADKDGIPDKNGSADVDLEEESTFTSLVSPVDEYVVRKVPIAEEISGNADAEAENQLSKLNVTDKAMSGELSAASTAPTDSMAANQMDSSPQVAQMIEPVPPVAVVTTPPSLTLTVIFVPMAISIAIFLLLWSVISGWFERLIV